MVRPASTVEADLARWAGARRSVSSEDESIVRALLLDSLAVMGTGSEERAARALAGSPSASSPGGVPVIGTPRTASPASAALLNATAGAAELWDDTSIWMNTHSSVPIFAALMSAADGIEVSLGDVIESYVVGLEVQLAVRAQAGGSLYLRGYHSTGLLGVIGAGVAVAHLRGCPPELIQATLGIAASMGSGLRVQFGSDVMALHSGLAAERGLAAADLAAAGIVPDERSITGRFGFVECHSDEPHVTAAWSGPMGLAAADIVLKRYPVGAPNIAPVDAALRVREQLGGAPELSDISSITCRADRWIEYTIGLDTPPARYAGRVNLPYCVIAALLHGTDLRRAFLSDEPVGQPERRLIESFHVEVGDFRDASGQRSAEVEIVVGGRRRAAWSAPEAYVHPSLEGSSGEAIRQKVLAVPAFGDAAAPLIETVAHGALATPFRTVVAPLHRAGTG